MFPHRLWSLSRSRDSPSTMSFLSYSPWTRTSRPMLSCHFMQRSIFFSVELLILCFAYLAFFEKGPVLFYVRCLGEGAYCGRGECGEYKGGLLKLLSFASCGEPCVILFFYFGKSYLYGFICAAFLRFGAALFLCGGGVCGKRLPSCKEKGPVFGRSEAFSETFLRTGKP